ncbi:hypothetical protein P153DRAFT_431402 [Dothidotthia symphoricarpi CBS 119687]|uniref:Helicase ATP-binding domain-containing protein n=1 Tax=Dothidotthia symphoricarpi CBS 119687 TaxID=1392245 RepID=A0A6A6AD10_9PLEO|nr:uncharacterized protein P153DRAFT_431402 [Dothidotthia symphoricarpi CBS 119687]KAF2129446.1 hypothetical protein P153DRAFT_431402 [Dothidotthia symphoricarpi CBS 119687]
MRESGTSLKRQIAYDEAGNERTAKEEKKMVYLHLGNNPNILPSATLIGPYPSLQSGVFVPHRRPLLQNNRIVPRSHRIHPALPTYRMMYVPEVDWDELSMEALGTFPGDEAPGLVDEAPGPVDTGLDSMEICFELPLEECELFQRVAAGRLAAAEGRNAPVEKVLTDVEKKEKVERDKAATRKKQEEDKKKKTQMDIEHGEKASLLYMRGLNEENPFFSSVHSLAITPKEFTHPSLSEDGESIAFRDHQLHAVGKAHHILNNKNAKPNTVLLNYGMGFGKTYIMHALMQMNKGPKQTMLLIVPPAILTRWTRQLDEKSIPKLRYMVYGKEPVSAKEMMTYELVVTTFQTVLRDWKAQELAISRMKASFLPGFSLPEGETIRQNFPLYLVLWSYMWVDECQSISGEDSIISLAVCNLHGNKRFGCTGIPIQNDYHSVQTLLRFLNVEPWNNSDYFADTFLKNDKGETEAVDLSAASNSFLAVSIRPHILRLDTNNYFNGKPIVTFPKPANHDMEGSLDEAE